MKDIYEVHDLNNGCNNTSTTSKEILEASEKPYLLYSTTQCEDLLKKIKGGQDLLDKMSDDEQDSDIMSVSSTENKSNSDEDMIEFNKEDEQIKMTPIQQKTIDAMKSYLNKGDQLLAMLQGSAGSGKTTICKELTKELGLQVKYTASTGSAAAQLRSGTVKSLLNLGRSKDFCKISEGNSLNFLIPILSFFSPSFYC